MSSWGYKPTNGPAKWADEFPAGAGKRQSPIDIVTKDAVYDSKLQGNAPLKINYTPETNMQVKNTGHSINAVIKAKSTISGGPLEGKYTLEQFHLHWGSDSSQGSEHTINGKTYASELHLVHWNSDKYGSFAEAADKSDGLAVIGIMIKEGAENAAFKPISDVLSSDLDIATVPGTFDPAKLLPENITDYWTYLGSLTTPPLYESVTWTVLREGIEFSKQQFQKLRSLKGNDGGDMVDNYRPPQPLNGRTVSASFQ